MTGPGATSHPSEYKGALKRQAARWEQVRSDHTNGPDGLCPICKVADCDEFTWFNRIITNTKPAVIDDDDSSTPDSGDEAAPPRGRGTPRRRKRPLSED